MNEHVSDYVSEFSRVGLPNLRILFESFRCLSHAHFVDENTKRVDVTFAIVGVALQDFRANVAWCAYLFRMKCIGLSVYYLGFSKISNLHIIILINENVVGLYIPMHNFLLMQAFQSIHDLLNYLPDLLLIHRLVIVLFHQRA